MHHPQNTYMGAAENWDELLNQESCLSLLFTNQHKCFDLKNNVAYMPASISLYELIYYILKNDECNRCFFKIMIPSPAYNFIYVREV